MCIHLYVYYLSNATCLIRPLLFHACFALQGSPLRSSPCLKKPCVGRVVFRQVVPPKKPPLCVMAMLISVSISISMSMAMFISLFISISLCYGHVYLCISGACRSQRRTASLTMKTSGEASGGESRRGVREKGPSKIVRNEEFTGLAID